MTISILLYCYEPCTPEVRSDFRWNVGYGSFIKCNVQNFTGKAAGVALEGTAPGKCEPRLRYHTNLF